MKNIRTKIDLNDLFETLERRWRKVSKKKHEPCTDISETVYHTVDSIHHDVLMEVKDNAFPKNK